MRQLSNDEVGHISGSGVGPGMFDGIGTAIGIGVVLVAAMSAIAAGCLTYFFTTRKEK